MIKWFRDLNKRHKAWYKNNGYVFFKPLFVSFFLVAFLLLVVIAFVDGFEDKVFVSCGPYGTYCFNPLVAVEDCSHYCCTIDYLPPGSVCGERVSWLGTNYSWLVSLLFIAVLLVNHFVFNSEYDFNKYFGGWK